MRATGFLTRYAMRKWDQQAKKMSAGELSELAGSATDLAVRAARLAAYCDTRYHYPEKHDEAVKHQNRTARNVRRVLGFTYPKDDITFGVLFALVLALAGTACGSPSPTAPAVPVCHTETVPERQECVPVFYNAGIIFQCYIIPATTRQVCQ